MAQRGGRRRRSIDRGAAGVSIPGGRWGRRRVRVEECAATLRAEIVYDQMIREGSAFAPGSRATLSWTPHKDGFDWTIEAEVVRNAVWRRGRVFLRCRQCRQRATRLYVPVVSAEPRCRRCWGLSYVSRSWAYKACGIFAYLGPLAYVTTYERRRERRRQSRLRFAQRRLISAQPIPPERS